jgi:GAF domain-containing protein
LFLARELLQNDSTTPTSKHPGALDAGDYPILQRILRTEDSVLISDTNQDHEWRIFNSHAHLKSWLCVPLIASHRTVGLLSLGHSVPGALTSEHLRTAQLLAIPAAAAIQNARLYERAEIYSEELEKRLADLRQAQSALARVGKSGDFPTKRLN